MKRLHPYGWYLQYLFTCYIVFYFGIRFISNKKLRYGLWIGIALCSFLICSNLQGEQALSFLSGLFVAEYVCNEKNISPNYKHMLSGVGLLFMSVVLLAIKQLPAVRVYAHIYTLFNLCIKTSCVAGVLLVSGWKTVLYKPFVFLGGLSYALYLVHGYFMWIVSDNLTGYYLLNALILLAVSVAVAIMLNQIVVILQKRKA